MKKNYDVVIIGGGAQGLSLAYNLARKGLSNVAVLDKSYPGSGASGRNGEMVRSAFASEEWIRFFDASLKIWQTLSRELDFNLMFNRRGYLVLASTPEEMAICQSDQTFFNPSLGLLEYQRLYAPVHPGGIFRRY
jgi:sarcosine oxidase subunit beta